MNVKEFEARFKDLTVGLMTLKNEIVEAGGFEKETSQTKNQDSDLNEIQKKVHKNAVNKGFWKGVAKPHFFEIEAFENFKELPKFLCLIHSEVTEALEAYRTGSFEAFKVELADIVIRTADLAEGMGINLSKEIAQKHDINLTRPEMHGGLKC